jgi:hypothetical protein
MLSTTSLLSLLPLLALVSAFPFDPSSPSRLAARQQNGTTTTGASGIAPLAFQSVGDAGISAQMVCSPALLSE